MRVNAMVLEEQNCSFRQKLKTKPTDYLQGRQRVQSRIGEIVWEKDTDYTGANRLWSMSRIICNTGRPEMYNCTGSRKRYQHRLT